MGSVLKVLEHYGVEVDRNNKACCPVHNEKTPSFQYYEETDSYHCFGCGVNGDAIGLILEIEDWDKHKEFHKALDVYNSVVGDGKYDKEEDIDLSNDIEFTKELFEEIKAKTTHESGGYRGIDSRTTIRSGVRYEYSDKGEVIKSYYPATKGSFSEGKKGLDMLTGFKVRIHPKSFSALGKVGRGSEFFMQHMFPTHKGFLLICEGEIDSLSAYQMLVSGRKSDDKYDEIAVVSPLNGANSLAQTIKDNYEWVSQFKRVIICMDNDAAGKKAADEAMSVVPKGRGYIVPIRRKDVNEFLMSGDQKGFLNDFWNMKLYTPEGIYSSTQLYDEALLAVESTGISLPDWAKGVTKFTYGFGIPENEIFVITSITSGGKSLFVNNLTIHWVLNEPKHTVGVLSLEATAGRYARNLLSSYLGVPLNRMTAEERKEYLTRDYVKEKSDKLFVKEDGSPKFWILDDRGADITIIKEKTERMIRELGCTIIVIDVWSDLLSSMSVAEQEDLATWLKKVQKETGVTPVLISHIRKGGADENDVISEDGMMGSSFLAKASGLTLALERNKQAEDPMERNTTRLRILKNREHAETGVCSHVYFNQEDQRLYDLEDYLLTNPHLESGDGQELVDF